MTDYLDMIGRRKWLILVTLVTACAVSGVAAFYLPANYSAVATVRFAETQADSPTRVDTDYSARLIHTYSRMLHSLSTMEQVVERLQLNMAPRDLLEATQVEAVADTELVAITATDRAPWRARDIANALAQIMVEQARSPFEPAEQSPAEILAGRLDALEIDLNRDRETLQGLRNDPTAQLEADALAWRISLGEEAYRQLVGQVEEAQVAEDLRAESVTVVDPAVTPETPVGPRKMLIVAVGATLGVIAAAGVALLVETLDTTAHTAKQVGVASGLPVLGVLPSRRQGQATLENGLFQEAYGLLSASLLAGEHGNPAKALLIAGAGKEDGAGDVVANLARVLAKAGRKVVAVDGDLRAPTLHRAFDLPSRAGLSTVLERRVSLQETLQDGGLPGLRVLTGGPHTSEPAALLESSEMLRLMADLLQDFDVVLVSAPPLLSSADASILAKVVGRAALLVELGRTKLESVQASLDRLALVQAAVVGLIVSEER